MDNLDSPSTRPDAPTSLNHRKQVAEAVTHFLNTPPTSTNQELHSKRLQEEPLFTQYIPRTQPRLRPKDRRVSVRSVGFSAADEAKLKELQELLSGGAGVDDKPSASLLIRASISDYLVRLMGIKARSPQDLETERHKLANTAKRINRGTNKRSPGKKQKVYNSKGI